MTVANVSDKTNTTGGNIPAEYVSAWVLEMLFGVLGVFGNFIVVFSILKQKNLLKQNYHYLVFHLAVCDLITLLMHFLDIIGYFNPNFTIFSSSFTCRALFMMSLWFRTAGSMFMILIGVFRCRAVLHPLKPAVNRYKMKLFASLVYISTLICSIPSMLLENVGTPWFACIAWSPPTILNILFGVFVSAIIYVIPAIVLPVLYYTIYKALLRQYEQMNAMNSTHTAATTGDVETQTNFQKVKHRRNIQTFINCVAVVVCFTVAGFPVHLWIILYVADLPLPRFYVTYVWLQVVYVVGTCAVNPFIYGLFDENLLFAFKRSFGKIRAIFRSCKKESESDIRENIGMSEINV